MRDALHYLFPLLSICFSLSALILAQPSTNGNKLMVSPPAKIYNA